MCVDFVKQRTQNVKTIKQNYEHGYQQCLQDVGKYVQTTSDISTVDRQRLLNQLSNVHHRRYQPYRTTSNNHQSIVNEWFHRCGASSPKQQTTIDSSSERSDTSTPSSIDDHSERSSSSLWRPW